MPENKQKRRYWRSKFTNVGHITLVTQTTQTAKNTKKWSFFITLNINKIETIAKNYM